MTPTMILVGADKGGVGKTTIARALMDYFETKGIEHRAFDTEGVLRRFQPEKTQVVDLTKSDGQMAVFDTVRSAAFTVIDIRAGLLTPTLKTLADIGFLDDVKESKIKISVMHVLGSSLASLDEIAATQKLVEGSRHYLVQNHINDAPFLAMSDAMKKVGDGLLDIPMLDTRAADTVDTAGVSFNAFMANEGNSLVLRRYVRHWLGLVGIQLATVGLGSI